MQSVSKGCNHGDFSDTNGVFHIQSAIQKTISDLLKSETSYRAEVL